MTMEFMYKQIQYKKEEHLHIEILELLNNSDLPTSDLEQNNTNITFISASQEDSKKLLGVVGLEEYESEAILRSLAVRKAYQKRGIGKNLVNHLEQYAAQESIRELYLLTETADSFFKQLGYNMISKEEAPEQIQRSSQFSQLCPSSAICMYKKVNG